MRSSKFQRAVRTRSRQRTLLKLVVVAVSIFTVTLTSSSWPAHTVVESFMSRTASTSGVHNHNLHLIRSTTRIRGQAQQVIVASDSFTVHASNKGFQQENQDETKKKRTAQTRNAQEQQQQQQSLYSKPALYDLAFGFRDDYVTGKA